jgi:hypothetical protein
MTPTTAAFKPQMTAARNVAKRFLELARSLTADAGLDLTASAEGHPRHSEYVLIIERAWKEASLQ